MPPPAQPVTEVIFIFGTGDDDLRSGSELDVAILKPDSTVIVIGNQTVVEIWAAVQWDSYSVGALANFTENVNRVTQNN